MSEKLDHALYERILEDVVEITWVAGNLESSLSKAVSPLGKVSEDMGAVIENVCEATFCSRGLYSLIPGVIPFMEYKLLIIDLAEAFEAVHKDTDWLEQDYSYEIERFARKGIAGEVWKRFGEVPVDPKTEEIEEDWCGFPKGTHREEIWHWMEEVFDISVAEDLMSPSET